LTEKRIKFISSSSAVSSHVFFKSAFPSKELNLDFLKSSFAFHPNLLDHSSLIFLVEKPIEKINEKNLYFLKHQLCETLSEESDIKNLNKRLLNWMNLSSHPNILKPLKMNAPNSLIVELSSLITLRGFSFFYKPII